MLNVYAINGSPTEDLKPFNTTTMPRLACAKALQPLEGVRLHTVGLQPESSHETLLLGMHPQSQPLSLD